MIITSSIVAYKSNRNDLQKVIECVNESIIDTLFVIDNSPTNELKVFVLSLSDKIEYIFGHGNIGYGAGHNIAIRKSIELDSKYHVVINPDIIFEKNVIEELKQYMDDNLNVGQIMPKVFYPSGELQYLCKLVPTPYDFFIRFLPFKALKDKYGEKFELRFTGYNKIMNIPYLSGCFMFFRVDSLKDIGLFDEKFFMYPEDFDITRRMHEKYKTIFYPYVSIVHAHAAESKKNLKMMRIHIYNTIKYFNKWGWIIDSKRKKINKNVLRELNYSK